MADTTLPSCAFPHCEGRALPDADMCSRHDHCRVSGSASYLEPAERNQT